MGGLEMCAGDFPSAKGSAGLVSSSQEVQSTKLRICFIDEHKQNETYKELDSSYQTSLHLERLDLDSLHSFIQKLLLLILGRLLCARLGCSVSRTETQIT